MRIFIYSSLFLMTFFLISLEAADLKVDTLLEKVHHAKTKTDKKLFLEQLKKELAGINKKEREESDAIIEAKKKVPSKLFQRIESK